jgi:hypothetical protein
MSTCSASLINSCKIKHNNNNNNNTLVSGINGQGLNGAKNALTLWNEFCRSGLQKFVEEFVAANQSLVECILFWRALSIAITSPLKLLTISSIVFPSQNDENCRVSAVIVVPSNPDFVWLFSSHFIDFEGSLCPQVFSPYIERLAFILSIVWS